MGKIIDFIKKCFYKEPEPRMYDRNLTWEEYEELEKERHKHPEDFIVIDLIEEYKDLLPGSYIYKITHKPSGITYRIGFVMD